MTTTTPQTTNPTRRARYVQAVVDLVRRQQAGTTFVEIERTLTAQGMNVEGDHCVEITRNLVLWAGVSEEFVDVTLAVQRTGQTHVRPTTALVYLCDGKHLNLPLAKRPPANGYKEPHWVPVCWSYGPAPTDGQQARSRG